MIKNDIIIINSLINEFFDLLDITVHGSQKLLEIIERESIVTLLCLLVLITDLKAVGLSVLIPTRLKAPKGF